jgi:uncharacterized protein
MRVPSRSLVAPLLLLVGSTAAQGQQTGLEKLIPPSPVPAGFIHDGGPVLNAGDLASLNARISAFQATGRGDIGVAILRDLKDYPPYEVGTEIYRAWKVGRVDSIGSERRDLGALLLIVPKELNPNHKGECWITTGKGSEGFITDATAATICRDEVIPHLKDQDYAGAIGAAISAIEARLSSIPESSELSTAPDHRGGFPWAPIGGGLGLLGLGAGSLVGVKKYRRRKPRLCPQGHGKMRLLDETADDAALAEGQRKEESLKSVDYDVWECPVCQERTVLRYKKWITSYSQCPSCHFWTVKTKNKTLKAATRTSTGLVETTKTCQNCSWHETKRHTTPVLTSSSSGSSSGGGGGGGGSSFGGSGGSSGGGGGSSY